MSWNLAEDLMPGVCLEYVRSENVSRSLRARCEVQTWDWSGLNNRPFCIGSIAVYICIHAKTIYAVMTIHLASSGIMRIIDEARFLYLLDNIPHKIPTYTNSHTPPVFVQVQLAYPTWITTVSVESSLITWLPRCRVPRLHPPRFPHQHLEKPPGK